MGINNTTLRSYICLINSKLTNHGIHAVEYEIDKHGALAHISQWAKAQNTFFYFTPA